MPNTTWDLTQLFTDEDEWFDELETAEMRNADIEITATIQALPASILALTLADFIELSSQVEKLAIYGQLSNMPDLMRELQPLLSDVLEKAAALQYYLANIAPELLASPDLTAYKTMLTKFASQHQHLLAPAQESQLSHELIQQPSVAFNEAMGALMADENPDIDDYEQLFADILSTKVHNNNHLAQLHDFKSARNYYLNQLSLPGTVYSNLSAQVKQHTSLAQKYVQEAPAINADIPVLSIDQAKQIIHAALAEFGTEYVAVVDSFFDDGLIHLTDAGDAYSVTTYGEPTYISVSWFGDLTSLYELMHEIGHAMNHYLTHQHEPIQYGTNHIFTSEIAAIMHENLLTEYLLNNLPAGMTTLAVLVYHLQNFYEEVFVQAKYSEFEDEIHQLAVTHDKLSNVDFNSLLGNLTDQYDGVRNPADDNLWTEIPHFYNHSYYVFQYATGMLIGTELIAKLRHNEITNADFLNYLSIGESQAPVEMLATLGIDITSNPFAAAFSQFATDLDTLVEPSLAD
ncbi:hypothetical protein EQG49_00475 [Periweissella cryptocerci]|uniref:Peptidase M3A/M3B catalytic domain-containing protein n=1 Tax=Periweissella cryptocerci TaxID=2506420 RepID=A0A4P6YQY6_9LACO|nr:M3 family metallopeptidase [Periweissella cryptocerci]QBO35029.1 hypothetical protein EQG49_00475 [Periweissella cryptocerci]